MVWVNAGWDIADRYLGMVEATCQLLGQHPLLGPLARLTHPRLRAWRFMVVLRPFHRHVLFYEVAGSERGDAPRPARTPGSAAASGGAAWSGVMEDVFVALTANGIK